MVDRKTRTVAPSESARNSVEAVTEAQIEELVRRAPRFGQLAKAVKGGETEISDAQREFLDDFAAELAAGTESGDSSST